MLVTELGMVTEVRPDSEKAFSPMLLTELGMVTELNAEQPLKESFPIFLTELPMVTEFNLEQPAKVESSMLVTESPIIRTFIFSFLNRFVELVPTRVFLPIYNVFKGLL